MVNSWSLLYDELNMDEETQSVNDGMAPWGHSDMEFLIQNKMSEDTLTFNVTVDQPDPYGYKTPTGNVDITVATERFKYNEDAILKELKDYISATYNQHYSSEGIQTLDLIESCGDGEAFCRSNILKYASRYDKKGTARRDIMKILHYAVLLLNFNDKNAKRETYETF